MSVRRPAVGLSANLPVGLPACQFVCLPVYLSSTCLLPVCYLPAWLHACLPGCLFACLSARLHKIIDDCRINNCAHLLLLQIHDCGIAVADQHSLKSCEIAIAEVLSSSCGIAIVDLKKMCRPTSDASLECLAGPLINPTYLLFKEYPRKTVKLCLCSICPLYRVFWSPCSSPITTQSHWSSGSTVCFPSVGSVVCILVPWDAPTLTMVVLLLALFHYSIVSDLSIC
jgi:hypothetical protein